ncbi:hypothetical protein GF338_10225 [candidate division WOR-3 bacterium]|nr:hypothetical protein [candidate division WOR-3 bacterium]
MKKIIYILIAFLVFLGPLGCTNQKTVRRLNALYDEVNTIQKEISDVNKELKELNQKILDIKGPPTADLRTLQDRIEQVNDQYRNLATEIAKVQEKIGMTPMDTAPPKSK